MLRPFRGVLPRVHPTAFIDPSAQVIGDVEIGEQSSVWMTVVIRGDVHRIRMGRRRTSRRHHRPRDEPDPPDNDGDNVTVGHAAPLHGCTVEIVA
jgi:carbonic anhydrase/acetyltransferase-like protein (isoleucine patch superfamily)